MHDTPGRNLFEKHSRAFSSGCIRLEKPFELAELILESEEEAVRLEAYRTQQNTRYLKLSHPVPLMVTYWTAWLDQSGVVQFRADLYRHDKADVAKLRQARKSASNLDGSKGIVAAEPSSRIQ